MNFGVSILVFEDKHETTANIIDVDIVLIIEVAYLCPSSFLFENGKAKGSCGILLDMLLLFDAAIGIMRVISFWLLIEAVWFCAP